MEEVLAEPLAEGASLIDACKGGVVLCRLVNRIAELMDPPIPPLVKKIHASTLAFRVGVPVPPRPSFVPRFFSTALPPFVLAASLKYLKSAGAGSSQL